MGRCLVGLGTAASRVQHFQFLVPQTEAQQTKLKLVSKAEGDCSIVDKRVCDGTVSKVRPDGMAIVCTGGKFTAMKGRAGRQLGVDGGGAGAGCEWYGQVYCDGDIVQDLYVWWFQLKCAKGKMFVYSRSLAEVTRDPRFRGDNNNV